MAPEIKFSDPMPGEQVLVNIDTVTVYVVVVDENDSERVDFLWTITGEGPQSWEPMQGGGEMHAASLVKIDRDPIHDGRTLQVQATDSFGATVSQDWEISVLEEAR